MEVITRGTDDSVVRVWSFEDEDAPRDTMIAGPFLPNPRFSSNSFSYKVRETQGPPTILSQLPAPLFPVASATSSVAFAHPSAVPTVCFEATRTGNRAQARHNGTNENVVDTTPLFVKTTSRQTRYIEERARARAETPRCALLVPITVEPRVYTTRPLFSVFTCAVTGVCAQASFLHVCMRHATEPAPNGHLPGPLVLTIPGTSTSHIKDTPLPSIPCLPPLPYRCNKWDPDILDVVSVHLVFRLATVTIKGKSK
ncbi:hypothetical protein V8E53_005823 [Lactarius tabidus]